MSHCIRPAARPMPCLLLIVILSIIAPTAVAQVGDCEPAVAEAYLEINNVRARIFNNGNLFYRGDPAVYEVPKDGGVMAVFSGGLWVGGLADGELRVAASRYGPHEFWAGPLDDDGNPPDDCSTFDRIWKVSVSDVEHYITTGEAFFDLSTWPTGLGAPTVAPAADDGLDNDGDGVVDEEDEVKEIHREILELPLGDRVDRVIDLAAGERPAIIGDQMLWWIMNDRGNEHASSKTPPIGLEVHGTAFAFDQPAHIGNMTFYKANLYMKSAERLDSTYVSIFSDTDLGGSWDDYVGFDTTLGLGYVYNADNFDGNSPSPGYGENPPALGYDLFQGPVVPSAGDTAVVSGRLVPDLRNLATSSFIGFLNSGPTGDPTNGVEVYRYMWGRWKNGLAIRAHGSGWPYVEDKPETKIMFPGDPVTNAFWSEVNGDGEGTPNDPREKRLLLTTGPFTFDPGDHQEIVYGIVWARGADNLDSITELRDADRVAQRLYDVNFDVDAILSTHEPRRDVTRAVLYPNPVADFLFIDAADGFRSSVEITVHDLLGRVVARQSHSPNEGRVRLDVSMLPAGRYFVRLKAGPESETHLVVKR